MGRTKKSVPAAAEAAQNRPESQEVSQDVQEAERQPEAAVTQEIIGPEVETELLGCQEDEAELVEGLFTEYAVAAEGGLNLRQEPRLDAPVVAVLPRGAGVCGNDSPGENGWRQVFTGRLFGWVMDQYLEPLEPPDLNYGAD